MNNVKKLGWAAVAAAALASGAFGTEAWRHGERQAVWPEGKIPDFQPHQVGAMTDETLSSGTEPRARYVWLSG